MELKGVSCHVAAVAAMLAGTCMPALAQGIAGRDSGPVAAQVPSDNPGDIVVTAQRREQRLQDVPISVSAISGANLANAGIETIRSINVAVPSITVSQTPTGLVSTYIRGVGSSSANVGDEPSVASYLDGFYLPTANMAFFSLGNVQRIEVLKGPQGTLFGRNSSGGVVQIVTSDPSFTPTLNAGLGIASFFTISGNAYASTGLTDKVALDLGVQFIDQKDGWGRNLTTGRDVNKLSTWSARSKLLIEPSDNLRVVLAGDYVHLKTDIGTARSAPPGNIAIDIPNIGGLYDTQQNVLGVGQKAKNWGVQSTVELDLGGVTLKNLAQYRGYRQNYLTDPDYGPLNLIQIDWLRKDRLFTEEFQIASGDGAPFQWIAGAFYMNYTSEYDRQTQQGSALSGRVLQFIPFQRTKSFAPFAQATVELLPSTNLTGGFRYTFERKFFSFGQNVNGGPVTTTTGTLKQKSPGWRISIDHKFSPAIMVYASYNRGFKSGGFNVSASPIGQTPVKPEKVDAYEIGAKAQFLGGKLTTNVALFYNDFKGLQVQRLIALPSGASAAVLANAATSTIKGVDFEVTARPVPGLTLNVSGTYLDAHYDSFPNVGFSARNPNGTGTTSIPGDASGLPLVRSPKFAMTAGVDYGFHIGASRVILSGSVYHNSGFAFEPDQRLRQPRYNLINAKVRLEPGNAPFGFSVFATNLTDKHYYVNAASSAFGDSIAAGEPRVIGVSMDVKL